MDKNEERVQNSTLVQLWNDEIIDRERIAELRALPSLCFAHLARIGIKRPSYTVIARNRWRRWQSICRKPSPPRSAAVKC